MSKKQLLASSIFPEMARDLAKNPQNIGNVKGLFIISVLKRGVKKDEWFLLFQGKEKAPIISQTRPNLPKSSSGKTLSVVLLEVEDRDIYNFITGGLQGLQAITSNRIKIAGDLLLAQQLEELFVKAGGIEKAKEFVKRSKLSHTKRIFPTTFMTVDSVAISKSRFLAETNLPLCRLEAKKHFDALTITEKKYAHYIGKASWEGAPILASTMSYESLSLCQLFIELFTDPNTLASPAPKVADFNHLKKSSGVSDETWNFFMEYAVQVLDNLGNFKSFGDVKFVPRLSVDEFSHIIKAIGSFHAQQVFESIKNEIYDLTPASCLLGYPADGHVSGYYSSNISKDDVDFVQKWLESTGLSALNTRLFKKADGSLQVLVASASVTKPSETFSHDGKNITVIYGDFNKSMAKIAANIEQAIPFAANVHQTKMLNAYAKSFRNGSIDEHKDSQRHWIRDVGPIVESNIGFIETYRDPAGVRAEWEGFVAVVNKEMTKKFESLVNAAPDFIALLPWGKAFEKDVFNRPDFTSLEVVSFATSGSPPAGINIPNYDDIRQTEGFKNVSLGNVVGAKAAGEKVTFLTEQDIPLYEKYRGEAFEVQVGLHELLGHGSGKLLSETTSGVYNFDLQNPPISPITKKPVTTWYKPGETWGSVFKSSAASYEECRAEAVALFLCVKQTILNIFGYHEESEMNDIIYICYLNMARAGLMALEFYDPSSKKWGQAHVQARYALLQVMLKAGIVKIQDNQAGDLIIHLDRSQILTKGVEAVGDFLMRLNVYKATADAVNGIKFYQDATSIPDSWLPYRNIVLSKKQPRKVFVQGNTFVEGSDVVFKDYPLTYEGFIQSHVERGLF